MIFKYFWNLIPFPNSNTSIRNRLLIYFVIIVILPVTLISTTLYNRSSSIIVDKTNNSIQYNLNLVNTSLIQQFDSIYSSITALCMNNYMIQILSKDNLVSSNFPIDRRQITSEMTELSKILENYSSSNSSGITMIPRLYIYGKPEYQLNRFTNNVFDIGNIEDEKWYKNLPAFSKFMICGLNKTSDHSGSFNTLLLAKRLRGLLNPDLQFAGVLTIEVPIKDFNYIFENFKLSQNSKAIVLNSQGTILLGTQGTTDFSPGKNISQEGYIIKMKEKPEYINNTYGNFTQKVGNEDMLLSYKKINELDLTILSFTPMMDINGELYYYKNIVLSIIIICVIVALYLAFLLSYSISNPIQHLVLSMAKASDGNFDVKFSYTRNDEFKILVDSYKKMINKIENLIQKLYISELEKKDAELQALQAQINPHFLYNTLDSVNWLAMKHKVPDISTMVKSLSNFFRFSLSKGQSIITLRDEIIHIESYLTIQKIRFHDKLNYTINFSPELLDFITVKLILQPLVENAIIHGIEKIEGAGLITISAIKKENTMEISVSDNGMGTNADNLNEMMLSQNSQTKNFGIKNVNNRIKKYFGTVYGLTFSSNEDSGLTVTIKLPTLKTLEGYNAKNDNC